MRGDLGRAEALLRSGRAYLYEALDQAWQIVTAGETVSVTQRATMWLASFARAMNWVAVIGECAPGRSSRSRRPSGAGCRPKTLVAASHLVFRPSTPQLRRAARWLKLFVIRGRKRQILRSPTVPKHPLLSSACSTAPSSRARHSSAMTARPNRRMRNCSTTSRSWCAAGPRSGSTLAAGRTSSKRRLSRRQTFSAGVSCASFSSLISSVATTNGCITRPRADIWPGRRRRP